MTTIYKTAYPYFNSKKIFSKEQIEKRYTLTDDEIKFVHKSARGADSRLTLAVLFKVYQDFNYFPDPKSIPDVVITLIRKQLHAPKSIFIMAHRSTLTRMKEKIYAYYKTIRWSTRCFDSQNKIKNLARHKIIEIAMASAATRNYLADIINHVIEVCHKHRIELPDFNQLDRLVGHTRHVANTRIFNEVYSKISLEMRNKFDSLFIVLENTTRTNYHRLKYLPKNPTISHFRELLAHHQWISELGDVNSLVNGISKVKLQQFAEQARSLDASNYNDFLPPKRYALLVCLLREAKHRAKDALAETFCKTIRRLNKYAIVKLGRLKEEYRKRTFELLTVFTEVLVEVKEKADEPESMSSGILDKIKEAGGAEQLHIDCEQAKALNSNNHLPLIWKSYRNNRSLFFKLICALEIQSCTQNDSVLLARDFILANENNRAEHIPAKGLEISFTSNAWRRLIIKQVEGKTLANRRHLEVCVFIALAEGLNANDLFVVGGGSYADYRTELMSWQECKELISAYCADLNIPNDPVKFVGSLKQTLMEKSETIDRLYPDIAELVIDDNGNPILKRRAAEDESIKAKWLKKQIRERMPDRNIIDVLSSSHFYSNWAHEFGPISGETAKIDSAIERYILTTFAYGSAMRPTQTVKHIHNSINISAHMLSWINRRHVNLKMLDKARECQINFIRHFPLLKAWGNGAAVAADGTLEEIRHQTLLSEFHQRYMRKGGIAYHHVADNYVLLFSTFMPCGVWEAVEIIDGLLKNNSDIQPTIIHADTQGQSTTVFALTYLLGFKLMPRIRNWSDLTLFRPSKDVIYKHIDSLFGDPIDWARIELHWRDMMQVTLSIKEGKISSSILLRKLGSYSKRNHLYKAFQELGRVIRTLFLLEYISDIDLRETITSHTNKVELYNELSDWCRFGGNLIAASNDYVEMEKAVKYNDLLANSVILHNVIDQTNIIGELLDEGHSISKDDMSYLSPYLTGHLKRFGDYIVDLKNIPKSADRARRLVLW